MGSIDIDTKGQLILARETETARQLALQVIEKPVPRVWMIFIPILFVLYFSKIKQYESSLKAFAEHHLTPRHMILEAVLSAEKSGQAINIEKLLDQLGHLDEKTRGLCRDWLVVLVGHFQLLLAVDGSTYSELVSSSYLKKEHYFLFCQKICEVEFAVNQQLLSGIEGNDADLQLVTKIMDDSTRNLWLKEADTIFS
jgi:hypothetical protein